MVTLSPIPRALVPRNSEAASEVTGPNYDEFQSDVEAMGIIANQQHSILRITMPHVGASPEWMIEEGSQAALQRAQQEVNRLKASHLTKEECDILWVYEIIRAEVAGMCQIGIGGFAKTGEIRTDENRNGVILRNEQVRPEKVEGRRILVEETNMHTDVVNIAVADVHGKLIQALETYAATHDGDFETTDEAENRHRVRLVRGKVRQQFIGLLADESHAYVADGNHRSAAAAMLGDEFFPAVFFPAARMEIGPYNRLVQSGNSPLELDEVLERLRETFEIDPLPDEAYQPEDEHRIGLYSECGWFCLIPKKSSYDEGDAVGRIDSEIVQRQFFARVLGIRDAKDPRLTFVGANKDAGYLAEKVRSGEYRFAVTLPPVSMQAFIDVCDARQFMPPKSTWFQPKALSGLVMAERQ